jgi:hypothetical protein
MDRELAERIQARHNAFRRALVEAYAQIIHYEAEARRHRGVGGGWVVPWCDLEAERQEHCRIDARKQVSALFGDRLW